MEKDKELAKKDELVQPKDKEIQLQQLKQQVICGDCVVTCSVCNQRP